MDYQAKVLRLDLELELAHGLDERHALDVADGSAQLHTRRGKSGKRQLYARKKKATSIMQTSGSSWLPSTGNLDTRSTQSMMALVTWGMTCTVFPR